MSASIERFISPRLGGTTLRSSAETGPRPLSDSSSSQHCFMMWTDWRISSMRMQ
jgi:hypothetical protein